METYSVNLTKEQWNFILDFVGDTVRDIDPGKLIKGKDENGHYVYWKSNTFYNEDIEQGTRQYNDEKRIYDLWLNMNRRIKNQERAKNNQLSKLKKQIQHLQKHNEQLILTIKALTKK
jgi:hypothetical protein